MSSVVTIARAKSRRALRTAERCLHAGDADGAVSRAYYAAFTLARAALLLAGEAPRTHAGTQGRFWLRFVQTGRFPEHLGSLLAFAQEQRERADYDLASVYDLEAAADLVAGAPLFCEAAARLRQVLAEVRSRLEVLYAISRPRLSSAGRCSP